MEDAFLQKRRNRPIEITDIAISKVREARFYGLRPNEKYPLAVNAYKN